jgi:hypothetical protein
MSDLSAAYIIFNLKIKQPLRTNQNKTPHGLEEKDKRYLPKRVFQKPYHMDATTSDHLEVEPDEQP